MRKQIAAKPKVLVAVAFFVLSNGITFMWPARAFALPAMINRFDRMSSASVSDTATHLVGFTITQTTTALGSVEIEFCSNNPFPGAPCTPPNGFDLTGASLSNQSGNTGFTIHPSSNINRIVLTRIPSLPSGVASTYQFDNVINPSTVGSYFVRLRTFSSTDASGGPIEEGGIAFAINDLFNVASEVPPYLKFCTGVTIVNYDCSTATNFFINLGEFSASSASSASSEFVLATNAGYGLSVSYNGTTLTSGNNTISELVPGGGSLPGTSQFGINLRANTNPGVGSEPNGPGTATVRPAYITPNVFRFVSGESIVSTTTTSDNQKFTVSYLVNVSGAQPAGVYATTLTFICLANF